MRDDPESDFQKQTLRIFDFIVLLVGACFRDPSMLYPKRPLNKNGNLWFLCPSLSEVRRLFAV